MPTLKPSKLRIRTLDLLRNRPITLTLNDIAAATGLGTPWLQFFACSGETSSPGVDKIEILYDFLSAKPLKVS